jgi:aminodeoxyfutalosine deaminase
LIVHRAAWVLPIDAAPIRDGWVAVDRGLIVALGGPGDVVPNSDAPQFPSSPAPQFPSSLAPQFPSSPAPQFPSSPAPPAFAPPSREGAPAGKQMAILPGLVNAHVHLELSWMRGAVPSAETMPMWASQLIAARRTALAEPDEPIADAIAEVRGSGTALVGDVTNTLASYEPLARSSLSAAIFFEQLGFKGGGGREQAAAAQTRLGTLPRNPRLRASVVPHAPYSVSPDLMRAIAGMDARAIRSIHLAESGEELQFLKDGSGAWRDLLGRLDAWDPAWKIPGCGPVEYLERLGLVDDRLLAVHGVQLTDRELARLADARATVATCPRSNSWTGAGAPPIERFYRSGVRVVIGTDSLASVDTLNVFDELARMRAIAPAVAAATLLESATRAGAEALGFGAELGTIAPGKRAELIAVRLPARVVDVEEYLVGGIQPSDIRWLETDQGSR